MQKYINSVIDKYNVIVGAITTVLTAIFGAFWYLFATYAILNTLDYLTGWYKSRKLKVENSKKGLNGIIKKLGYWVILAVAFLVSNTFIQLGTDLLEIDLSFLGMIGWFTLAMLMINEARSILENLVECGYSVPEFLIKGLAVTQKIVQSKVEREEGKKT